MAIKADIPVIAQEIIRVSERLQKGADEMWRQGHKKAETERNYRVALSKEILKLRSDGVQVALIPDMAKGNVAELMFERDKAEALFKASQEALDSLRSALSALQSVLRWQDSV